MKKAKKKSAKRATKRREEVFSDFAELLRRYYPEMAETAEGISEGAASDFARRLFGRAPNGSDAGQLRPLLPPKSLL